MSDSNYEIGSGRAPEPLTPSRHDSASLKLLDAAMLILGASWEANNKCDGTTISAAIRILEQLERRLVAGKL